MKINTNTNSIQHAAWGISNASKRIIIIIIKKWPESASELYWPPLVEEVSAKLLRIEGAMWLAWWSPTAVFSVF
jgi:hypothetical protein